jgi:hypothetical protein
MSAAEQLLMLRKLIGRAAKLAIGIFNENHPKFTTLTSSKYIDISYAAGLGGHVSGRHGFSLS